MNEIVSAISALSAVKKERVAGVSSEKVQVPLTNRTVCNILAAVRGWQKEDKG